MLEKETEFMYATRAGQKPKSAKSAEPQVDSEFILRVAKLLHSYVNPYLPNPTPWDKLGMAQEYYRADAAAFIKAMGEGKPANPLDGLTRAELDRLDGTVVSI